MRTILLAATMLVVTAAAAGAETFSLSGTDQVTFKMTARDASGRWVTTTMTTTAQQLTTAAGARMVTGRCTHWRVAAKRAGLVSTGTCELGDAAGTFSLTLACKVSEEQAGALVCAGETRGLTAADAAKTGTMSWRSTENADGSVRSYAGAGELN